MADTGWLTPSTVVNDTGASGVAWSSPSNAETSNNGYTTAATTGGVSNQFTNYLKATNYGFALDPDAIVSQVEVEVEGKSSGSNTSIYELRRVEGGTVGGADPIAFDNGPLTTSDAAYVSVWSSLSLDAATVNASDFGCALRIRNTNGAGVSRTVSVDVLRMRLTYDIPPPPESQTTRTMHQFRQRRT